MKRFHTSMRVSGGFLAAATLALAVPGRSMAATVFPHLETDSAQVQTVIQEWHWRNMAF